MNKYWSRCQVLKQMSFLKSAKNQSDVNVPPVQWNILSAELERSSWSLWTPHAYLAQGDQGNGDKEQNWEFLKCSISLSLPGYDLPLPQVSLVNAFCSSIMMDGLQGGQLCQNGSFARTKAVAASGPSWCLLNVPPPS